MALYAAIGAEFKSSLMAEFSSLLDERIKSVITRTLKQVAHDYDLNYNELKSRYCSKESLDEYDVPVNTHVVTVDLEEPEPKPKPEPVKKVPKVVKAKALGAVMALSKMKKVDLVKECEERGLDSEGTVSQLKERVKESREKDNPDKVVSSPKKDKAPPAKKDSKSTKKKKSEVVPPVVPVAVKEDEDICQRVEEFEEEDDGLSMQERLRKILAEANDEEFEEYEDE
jgi:hypothetical protein